MSLCLNNAEEIELFHELMRGKPRVINGSKGTNMKLVAVLTAIHYLIKNMEHHSSQYYIFVESINGYNNPGRGTEHAATN